MPRALLVAQAWPPVVGGAQRQAQRLLPLLATRGTSASVVTRRPDAEHGSRVEAGTMIHRVGDGWNGPVASLRFTAAAVLRGSRARPDVVHAHDLLSAWLVGAAVAALTRAPLVAKVASTGPGGDLDVLRRRRGGAARFDALARRTAAFACLTTQVVDELAAAGVPRDRLRLLPNGVDTAAFRPAAPGEQAAARRALGLPADAVVAVAHGRLQAVKRLDVLADACAALGVELLLAGEGPEGAPLAARPGVTVLPPVDDVLPLLHAADLHMSASLTEGMSNSALEAMACGLPLVLAPASGAVELVGEGAGALAEDGSVEALVAAARPLVASATARAAASVAARDHALTRFGLEAAADRMDALYRSLIAA